MERPIETPLAGDEPTEFDDRDALGLTSFVRLIQMQLFAQDEYGNRQGRVVGLTGPWGSGKSWVLNWTKSRIQAQPASATFVVEFNPWKSSQREDLIYAFLDTLRRELQSDEFRSLLNSKSLPRKSIEIIEKQSAKLGEYIAQALPELNRFGRAVAERLGLSRSAETFARTTDELYTEVSRRLEELAAEGVAFVVVLDDLDRLSDMEVRDVAQLVKAVGHFQNVAYLLAYDPLRVARALAETVADGLAYLEKIVQLQLRLPRIPPNRLRQFLVDLMDQYIESLVPGRVLDWANARPQVQWVVQKIVPDIVRTPRDFIRLITLLQARLEQFALDDEYVDFFDLVRFSALEVRQPLLVERMIPMVGRCTVDGLRELRHQQQTIFSGREVIAYLVGWEGDSKAASSQSQQEAELLRLLFPALAETGTETLARDDNRVCYETSLRTVLDYSAPERITSYAQAQRAVEDPTLLDRTLRNAADAGTFRQTNLRLRTVLRTRHDLPADQLVAFWLTLAKALDRPFDPVGLEHWDQAVDVAPVWARAALTRFFYHETFRWNTDFLKQLVDTESMHFTSCLLYHHCQALGINGCALEPDFVTDIVRASLETLVDGASETLRAKLLEPTFPALRGLYPLWLAIQGDDHAITRLRDRFSSVADDELDRVVCLAFRTHHERLANFRVEDVLDPERLLPKLSARFVNQEDRMTKPVADAYRFVREALIARLDRSTDRSSGPNVAPGWQSD